MKVLKFNLEVSYLNCRDFEAVIATFGEGTWRYISTRLRFEMTEAELTASMR